MVDYIAKEMVVKLEASRSDDGRRTSLFVTLRNGGKQNINGIHWRIVFCYNNAYIDKQQFSVASGAFSVSHLEGNIYFLSPTPAFNALELGRDFRFQLGRISTESDAYPNWYVESIKPGVVPKLIACTRMEAFQVDFSKVIDPPSVLETRYQNTGFVKAPNIADYGVNSIIPTPLEVHVEEKKHKLVVKDWSDWSIIHSAEVQKEGKYLSGKKFMWLQFVHCLNQITLIDLRMITQELNALSTQPVDVIGCLNNP